MPVQRNDFSNIARREPQARKAALKAMGTACLQVAQPMCPVRTGNLRRSHKSSATDTDVRIGVTAEYGAAVHNGTSRQKAQPWLRKAAEANKNSIIQYGIRQYSMEIQR